MLSLNFTDALRDLGPNAAFTFANEVRPPDWFLFNRFLPERPEPEYVAESGNITVRSAMAGLVATDSPYPPTGITQVSTFIQEVAKIANYVTLPERSIRKIQALLVQKGMNSSLAFIQTEVLNFLEKVLVQGHLDTFEWLRAQAITSGAISWTFNNQTLAVTYGIPSANILTTRTSTAAWDSTASAFWTDVALLQSALNYNVEALIVHPNTLTSIINNDVNKIEMISQVDQGNGTQVYTFRRLIGSLERPDSDVRRTIQLIAYGLEAEVMDPAGTGADITQKLPFMPEGKMVAIAGGGRTGYRVGEGSTDDPYKSMNLGYTHLAPTVEGGAVPGRWAQVFTPEAMPMQLHGRAVTNGLPVIEVPEKIAIASSNLS
ncbi:MAG: hypothetical protein DRI46_08410 [Chloroflexi bacterium]|nr:MAG: hypothetical protein DRI46_08410 [Chloroflexota bacterium]